MSSSAKGASFELLAHSAVLGELRSGALGLMPDRCKLFHGKGYYSKDRESDLIFDLSIELYRPGYDCWSLLWIWECKNYSALVPVDDVEEYWAKVQQVCGANIKASIITSVGLQRGALAYARSKGIGVAIMDFSTTPQLTWIIIIYLLARSRFP